LSFLSHYIKSILPQAVLYLNTCFVVHFSPLLLPAAALLNTLSPKFSCGPLSGNQHSPIQTAQKEAAGFHLGNPTASFHSWQV